MSARSARRRKSRGPAPGRAAGPAGEGEAPRRRAGRPEPAEWTGWQIAVLLLAVAGLALLAFWAFGVLAFWAFGAPAEPWPR